MRDSSRLIKYLDFALLSRFVFEEQLVVEAGVSWQAGALKLCKKEKIDSINKKKLTFLIISIAMASIFFSYERWRNENTRRAKAERNKSYKILLLLQRAFILFFFGESIFYSLLEFLKLLRFLVVQLNSLRLNEWSIFLHNSNRKSNNNLNSKTWIFICVPIEWWNTRLTWMASASKQLTGRLLWKIEYELRRNQNTAYCSSWIWVVRFWRLIEVCTYLLHVNPER